MDGEPKRGSTYPCHLTEARTPRSSWLSEAWALAAIFIWPFAYVTNFWALAVLSVAVTFGFAGFLATNVVYMSEVIGPAGRSRVIMVSQVACIVLEGVVLTGIVPHFMFPGQYRQYLWLLAGLDLLVVVLYAWRRPESPRWLEARGRTDQTRKVVARVTRRHPVLPEPALTPYNVVAEEKTSPLAVFSRPYVAVTVLLLVVMVLGYGGIVYGNGGYSLLFLSESRGFSADAAFAASPWAAGGGAVAYLINPWLGDRFERKYVQVFGAVLFAGCWLGLHYVHNTTAVYVLYIGSTSA